MSSPPPRSPRPASRRDFLSGRALRGQIEESGEALTEALLENEPERIAPDAGPTVRVQTRAMACEFAVVMNPGPPRQVMLASDALDMIHALEAQMTVYRPESELSRVNQRAAFEPVVVERSLFDLLRQARELSAETAGAFDPTSGPLIALWRKCRAEGRIPTHDEIGECLAIVGMNHVAFLEDQRAIRFDRPGVELNLGAIGKGHAVDRAAAFLVAEGLESWLFHGGYSSVLVRGPHAGRSGWPVGLRNPLIPSERLGTILLRDQALSTSGSNVQYFRHAGQRYGHILDPRTGWPPSHLLSVTVVAPSAAVADALSTAFFVAGVENSLRYCDNHPEIGAIFVQSPERGRTLTLVVRGIPDGSLFFETEVQVEVSTRA
ncbi:MAG TPA: FAD:protein FMN transferase [Planctomycetaceae bacterium]|jgi:thiamine biosynthesis lipoprotein|nr:FAD:protein FMN transferase [Planctomycetaceae bacterium]